MTGRVFSLESLQQRMQWLQARQSVLATNVAHADTPGFRPSDLAPQSHGRPGFGLLATHPGHVSHAAGPSGSAGLRLAPAMETRASGNAVSLEEEMLKLADTQVEYQLAAGLYQRTLSYLRTAIGRRA